MDQLRDALKKTLGEAATDIEARDQPPPPLGDPLESEWGRLLRSHGGDVAPGMTMGQLTQRGAARVRALKEAGRGREADALKKAQEEYLRDRERRAWGLVKERFAALDLPEKAYRALKQEGADAEKVLAKLGGARGEALRGAGAARVRDALAK
ncbi:MAG: hypothetical protein ACOZNI_17990 [Myxococcota bacterium]